MHTNEKTAHRGETLFVGELFSEKNPGVMAWLARVRVTSQTYFVHRSCHRLLPVVLALLALLASLASLASLALRWRGVSLSACQQPQPPPSPPTPHAVDVGLSHIDLGPVHGRHRAVQARVRVAFVLREDGRQGIQRIPQVRPDSRLRTHSPLSLHFSCVAHLLTRISLLRYFAFFGSGSCDSHFSRTCIPCPEILVISTNSATGMVLEYIFLVDCLSRFFRSYHDPRTGVQVHHAAASTPPRASRTHKSHAHSLPGDKALFCEQELLLRLVPRRHARDGACLDRVRGAEDRGRGDRRLPHG